jgi:nucleotide-binding universal stress UspA family protein
MRTIVAPTDFSSVSINALNYAADLAAAIDAELILLHVVQIPIIVSEIPFTSVDYEKIPEEAEHELAVLVNQLFTRTKDRINIHHKLRVGSVGPELEDLCEIKKPFAVVMGTKGAVAAERLFLGSNIMFAINSLKYPVLIVPPNASFNGIKKIALASDLKEIESTKPIEFLKEYLKIFKSKLDIVHVVDHYRLSQMLCLHRSLSTIY